MKHHRVILAALLTVLALGVPCVAWYVVGMREVNQRARQEEHDTLESARAAATQLAERLGGRLQSLRDSEARRPYYHYQSLYHDPKGVYEGQSVIPSPLNDGPADPLIRAYFQVDANGQLTVPNYNEQLPEVNASIQTVEQVRDNRQLRDTLEPIVPAALAFNGLVAKADNSDEYEQRRSSGWSKFEASKKSQQQIQPQQAEPMRYDVLEQQAYTQNVQANDVYQELRSGNVKSRAGNQLVRVAVNPLEWRTVSLEAQPTLAAMRRVTTPQGLLAQGFVLSESVLKESLGGAAFPASCVPGVTASPEHGIVAAAIGDTGWSVHVDAREALAALPVSLVTLQRNFRQWFLAGVGAVSVAGICIVLLVWQSDRLARQRSQFAASAAHELRTPLAGLRMYSEMLAEGLGDPSKGREYARSVSDEAARLGRVVSNVLNFSRLERGKLNVRVEPGNLPEAVRECVERQRPALEAMGATVSVAIAEDVPAALFDRDAVAEIVQNLLDNGEKHTRGATDRELRVGVGTWDGHVELTVSDHGPGVSAEVRRRLFRPFERGNHADAPAGLGLGLTLVQALMQAHKGTVSYRDNPGGGAVFVVRFPIA